MIIVIMFVAFVTAPIIGIFPIVTIRAINIAIMVVMMVGISIALLLLVLGFDYVFMYSLYYKN